MLITQIKKFLVGKPLETWRLSHERLPKWKALAVFSSDALSSVAYATQETLIPLSLVSVAALNWSLPIGLAISILLVIVASSYWQTIRCYPQGGGSYIVTKENLGTYPGLVTAAALLIDYVLTVAVSAAAGVEAITSALPWLFAFRVELCIAAILFITLMNLRGIRESGTVFSIPTYVFIFFFISLIVAGFYRVAVGDLPALAPIVHETYPAISFFLVLKAFAAGCSALTGIEAISDGVMAFRKPEARNAQLTLLSMIVILASFFLGITALTHLFGLQPSHEETIVSQLAAHVFGRGFLYYCVQISTAAILFMAANTAFADFPRVCSFLARDRFLPRQFASLGDRLVFSKGILALGICSTVLVVIFKGVVHFLIPLYAVGVFLSFTLSQTGMVRRHLAHREKGWKTAILFSAVGALTTFVVLMIISITKFTHGAWVVVVMIPILVIWFRATREHYRRAAAQLALADDFVFKRDIKHTVVLPISGLHKGVIDAIKYARSISKDVRVVSVDLDATASDRLKAMWEKLDTGLPLVVLASPYRSVVQPILDYIRTVDHEADDDIVTVVIPEFVTARWWERIYHNQTAFLIRTALSFERGKVVTSVRYHLER